MVVDLKIDVTTGDVIHSEAIEYDHRLLFEDKTVEILAYPLEQVLAEKLHAAIYLEETNTRVRDFYDIYMLTATEYARGDEKSSLNSEIREFEIQPKYLELEIKIKNIQEQTIDYDPALLQVERLAKQGNIITGLPKETILIRKDLSDPFNSHRSIEVSASPLPTKVGKIGDNVVEDEEFDDQKIASGETATVTVGYILARENYSSLFLNLNAYSPGNRYIQLTQ